MIKRDVSIGMLILLITIFFAPPTVFAQQIRIPNVLNMDLAQARQAIETVGLRINVSGSTSTNDQRLNGKVASQNPAAGQNVLKGNTISVSTYQYQQPLAAVPNILNMDAQQAANTLQGVGLKYQPVSNISTPDQKLHGKVVSQNPAAGQKVAPGSPVSAAVYQYQQPLATVPNILNMDAQQATKALGDVGLKYQSAGTAATTEQSKNGKVSSQNPAAGQNVQKGSAVSVQTYQYQQPLATGTGISSSGLFGISFSGLAIMGLAQTQQQEAQNNQLNLYAERAKAQQEREQTLRGLQDAVARLNWDMQQNRVKTAQEINKNVAGAILGAPALGRAPQAEPVASSQQQTQTQKVPAQANTSVSLNINWGTPPYKVTSSDTRVAAVEWDSAANEYKLIVKGRGTSVITATDSKGVTNKVNFNAQ